MSIDFTYECKKPSTFPKTYLIDVSYLAKIMQSSEAVLRQAIKQPDEAAFKSWFGDFGNEHVSKFQKSHVHINKMLEHAEERSFIFLQTAAITLAMTDQSKNELEISFGTYTSLPIYSLGEMVVTVLHELSHKTPGLMTKDIVVGSEPSTALGPGGQIYAYKERAVKLAASDPGKAFQNAENWGYYLASYHTAAELDGCWDYTNDRKDIERKQVGSPSAKTGDHWKGGYWVKHENVGCVMDPAGGLPIIRYRVSGTATSYDRASTPLPGNAAPATTQSAGVLHVAKAVVNDGPHKCGKCGRGFPSVMARNKHTFECGA